VAGHPSNLLMGAAAGFFLGSVGRELVRTAADRQGDEACGIRTVATAWGGRSANQLGLALILAGLGIAQIGAAPVTIDDECLHEVLSSDPMRAG
jgi:4-hydroxybenzoate polyprenyltransferase